MGYIEIWRSKPEWHQLPVEEQSRIRHAMDDLVQRHRERMDDTCGPFMPCNNSSCTLIWEVPATQATRLKKEAERILSQFFVPIMSGNGGELTARDYASRMSQG